MEMMHPAGSGSSGSRASGTYRSAGLGRELLRAADSDEEGEEEADAGEDDGDYDDEDGDLAFEVGSDGYVDVPDQIAGLSEAEQAVMSSFFGQSDQRRTLNEIILDKIREKQDAADAATEGDGEQRLPDKVVRVYTEIAKVMKHYRSGKFPKAFKIIPALSNWEQVLWMTRPDEWSPTACYQATRMFASNLNERMAQRFYNLVLLERVKGDIDEHKRLNYHLYLALRKSVYKPQAFFRGILLPLASEGCDLKQATIIGSVLAKVSIPVNHSAVALLKLSEMPYSGGTSLFMRILLNKKYALPHRVIDSLVEHFCRFEQDSRTLPVLWHQCLLVFAQRYKHDISSEQKEQLKMLLRFKSHYQITPEIRRELFSGHAKSEAGAAASSDMDLS